MHETGKSAHVWVFTEIQDHERAFDGALELLSRGRELADELGEKLCALLLGLDAEKYLPVISEYGPDTIYLASSPALKHYHDYLYPAIIESLIHEYSPSILLVPATEAGRDLAPRLASRFVTGMTAHCTGLEIVDHPEYGRGLLLMKRPAFSGNMIASIICPSSRPQIATVQPGVFEKRKRNAQAPCVIPVECPALPDRGIEQCQAPLRWDSPKVPLESSPVVVAGGRGMVNRRMFDRLFPLAERLGGEVGATRIPVFRGWCGEERMIGQTGKNIHPDMYIAFGISGQVQHTAAVVDSTTIVSVNSDPSAPIFGVSDVAVYDDAAAFCEALIERLRTEKNEPHAR